MAWGTRGVLVPGYPCPAQPTTPTSGMCGRGAGSSCGSRVSWAQLSHIRPGPAGRSRAWDAPVPATRPEGGTLTAPGRSNGGCGAVEPQGWGGPGTAIRAGVWPRLSFPPKPRGREEVRRQLLLLFLLSNASPSSQALRAWGLMLDNPRDESAWTPSLAFPVESLRPSRGL